MSCNTKIQMIQYKVIHRTHITSYKLQRMGYIKNIYIIIHTVQPPLMINFMHCGGVRLFSHSGRSLLNANNPVCSIIALLGDMSTLQISNHLKPFLLISGSIEKKHILLNWKNRTELSINHWLKIL